MQLDFYCNDTFLKVSYEYEHLAAALYKANNVYFAHSRFLLIYFSSCCSTQEVVTNLNHFLFPVPE